MKRNLIALFAILVGGSLMPRMICPLDVCGVRPGMTRAQVERILARKGDALPSGLPWLLREGRAELPSEHLTVTTDSDCERGNVFREATLTR